MAKDEVAKAATSVSYVLAFGYARKAGRIMRTIMVFIDGWGLGVENPETNPYVSARTPAWDALVGGHHLYRDRGTIITDRALMLPIDASLGVPGIPQSATGQCTLWTGVNASRYIGRHLRGFPDHSLRQLLATESIFQKLLRLGKRPTYANAFRPFVVEAPNLEEFPISASTYMTLSAKLRMRTLKDLLAGRAVFQDITNQFLVEQKYDVPIYTPEQSGTNLAALARDYDFTLFEFFQTDVAAHAQDLPRARELLERLDAFCGALIAHTDLAETLIIITSDHGNIEDLSVKDHTLNPVPLLAVGRDHLTARGRVQSLVEVTPWIIERLVETKGESVAYVSS